MKRLIGKLGLLAMTTVLVLWIGWEPLIEQASRPGQPGAVTDPSGEASPGIPVAPADSAGVAKLDLNHATLDELASLPGVGHVLASRIIEQRDTHGFYERVEDLLEVRGIGQKRLAQLRPLVRLTRDSARPRPSSHRRSSALSSGSPS